jgi:hypothetical protein
MYRLNIAPKKSVSAGGGTPRVLPEELRKIATIQRQTRETHLQSICSQRMVGPTFQWPRPETVWLKGSERAAAMACCRLMLDWVSGWRLSPKKDESLLHSRETVDGPRAA